ncbi:rRNA-processing protein UTP23 homolog [Euwallacea fornicatus]|uniref:rRNA-processing protein UTP23 homolog n=1 Tax=Euwallacea fornicatus TaxID=995702 RepID=UPI00338D996F
MKIRRYKKVSRNLSFYVQNFGFRQPYQLLADGTFCLAALNNKVNLSNDLPKYLQSEIKFITTQCAIIEMENLGSKLHGALVILKNYVVHKCGHEDSAIPAFECLSNMISRGNPNHYIVCTQDRDLQDKIRNLVAAPLLYLHVKTPVLEQPSEVSVKWTEHKNDGFGQQEAEKIAKLKELEGVVTNEEKIKRKRRKKGPNPLSCKKKQKKSHGGISKPETKLNVEKKKRKRVKIAKHIKEEILKRTFEKLNTALS